MHSMWDKHNAQMFVVSDHDMVRLGVKKDMQGKFIALWLYFMSKDLINNHQTKPIVENPSLG